MLKKLLCKLGAHDNHISNWDLDPDTRDVKKTRGYCTRCNAPWELQS